MVELLLALLTTMTGIPREVDPDLTAIAQRRAVEIQGDFSHAGWVYGRDGHAEIIAFNSNPDPVTRLALQWQGSPAHWAILTDPRYALWGCGISQAGDAFYGVCLLAASPVASAPPVERAPVLVTPPVPAPTPPVILLPNTALEPLLSVGVAIGVAKAAATGVAGAWDRDSTRFASLKVPPAEIVALGVSEIR